MLRQYISTSFILRLVITISIITYIMTLLFHFYLMYKENSTMLSELRNKDILSVIKGLLYTALGISFFISTHYGPI